MEKRQSVSHCVLWHIDLERKQVAFMVSFIIENRNGGFCFIIMSYGFSFLEPITRFDWSPVEDIICNECFPKRPAYYYHWYNMNIIWLDEICNKQFKLIGENVSSVPRLPVCAIDDMAKSQSQRDISILPFISICINFIKIEYTLAHPGSTKCTIIHTRICLLPLCDIVDDQNHRAAWNRIDKRIYWKSVNK